MLKQLKQTLRNVGVVFFRLVGAEIRDCRTGKPLGRGLVFWWGGRLHLLGCDSAVVPVPLPQKRLTYWKQSIGFTAHPEPDFSPARPIPAMPGEPPGVLLVLLDHREAETVKKTIALWNKVGFEGNNLLLVYGGGRDSFEKITHPNKVLLTGSRHKTSDHQRERQSYREVFSRVSDWLHGRATTHILFQEYDHLPMVADLATRMLRCLADENADVLAYQLGRVDASTNPHWLSMVTDSYEQPVALSMLGTGHFWRREAWDAVAADQTFADWYLELDLPTTAHHLGYRVRAIATQGRFVQNVEEKRPAPAVAMVEGAWTLHPVKDARSFAIVEECVKMQGSRSTRD
ncbi:MAG: hypothetical protein WCG66_04995 [bacterium]